MSTRPNQTIQRGRIGSVERSCDCIIFWSQLVRTVPDELGTEKAGPAEINHSLTNPPNDSFLSTLQISILFFQQVPEINVLLANCGLLCPPARQLKYYLNISLIETLFVEELVVQVGVVRAQMVAAGGQNASIYLESHQPPDRDVQCSPAHMFAHPDESALSQMGFLLLGVQGGRFQECSLGHNFGQLLHVEVGDIPTVSLEECIVFHEPVKLVPSRLPLQQDMLTFGLANLLHFVGNGVGEYAFASPKLQIYEIFPDQTTPMSLFCEQLRLTMIIRLPYFLLLSADQIFFGFPLETIHEYFDDFVGDCSDMLYRDI